MKIAIHGPMCSGKTTIANMIIRNDTRFKRFSFGQKVKDIAVELFGMEKKDRSLLINVANKMKDIDPDVWAKYVLDQLKNEEYVVIDDLRFENEIKYLQGWKIISLITPRDERIRRIQRLYPENYNDHMKNMSDYSEERIKNLPSDTLYLDTSLPMNVIEHEIKLFLMKNT